MLLLIIIIIKDNSNLKFGDLTYSTIIVSSTDIARYFNVTPHELMGKLFLIVPLVAWLEGNLFSSVSYNGIFQKMRANTDKKLLIQETKCYPRKSGSNFSLSSSTVGPGRRHHVYQTQSASGFAHGKVCSPEAASSSAMHSSAACCTQQRIHTASHCTALLTQGLFLQTSCLGFLHLGQVPLQSFSCQLLLHFKLSLAKV